MHRQYFTGLGHQCGHTCRVSISTDTGLLFPQLYYVVRARLPAMHCLDSEVEKYLSVQHHMHDAAPCRDLQGAACCFPQNFCCPCHICHIRKQDWLLLKNGCHGALCHLHAASAPAAITDSTCAKICCLHCVSRMKPPCPAVG